MRTILIIIFVLFPFVAFSQIETHLSFNRTDRTLVLVVKNSTDKLFRLCPYPNHDPYVKSGVSSFVVLKYKDVSGKVLFRRSFFLFEQLPISESTKGKFLFKYGENKYVYDLKKLYEDNINDICSVDIHVQIEAVSLKNKKDVYKEVIDKTYQFK